MGVADEPATGQEFALLIQLDMEMDGFVSDWVHCDRFSTYVARMVSHNRTDSQLYANLFSSAFNELLETAFRLHRADGPFGFSVWRRGSRDRIELTIPCDAALSRVYRDAARQLEAADIAAQFRGALFSAGPLSPTVGLLELAVDYNAEIKIVSADDKCVRLAAEFLLEDA